MQSFSNPERKDRVGDSHGGVLIYVKEGFSFMPKKLFIISVGPIVSRRESSVYG